MMTALSSYMRAFVLALSLGALAVQTLAADREGCKQRAAGMDAPLSDHARMLLDALGGESISRDTRLDQLHTAVVDPPEPLSTAEYWLTQKATLVIAGEYIRAGEFRAARSLLRGIPLESPAAVEAGLLLAESFRLENRKRQAQQWYLRMGKRFPHSHDTLRGLLSAARAMSNSNPEAALTLYEQVADRASETAVRLNTLHEQVRGKGLSILLEPKFAATSRLRAQVLQRLARGRDRNVIALKHDQVRNTNQLACLLAGSRPLYQARAGMQRKLAYLDQRIPRLKEQLQVQRQRLDGLRKEVRPGRLDEEQRRIRKAVMTVRNRIRRERAELKFLRETRQKLPRMIQRLEERLLTLYEHYRSQAQEADQRLQTMLSNSIERLRDDFLDTAGEARHRHAALLEASSASGSP